MIRISERDIAPEKQFQKLFRIISEDISGDYLKQVLITPYGRQIRYLDPVTRKQVKVDLRSFDLGYKSSLKNKSIKISSRDTSRILYTAIVLDDKSRQQLQSIYPGIHENYFANHVTLTFGKNEPHPMQGQTASFTADGYANDKNGEAVAVNIGDIEHSVPIPHVTISTTSGVPPKYSQELLSGKIEKIPPIPLSGRISAFNGRSFV